MNFMKIFKYSRVSFLCQIILTLFCVYFVIHGIKLFTMSTNIFNHNDIIGFFAFFIMLTPFVGEYLNRVVEFKDEYIVFNSFRIDKKVRSYNIRYEDVLSLDAVKIPLLGFYKIKVKAKNVPYTIPVTWCMKNHNKLFCDLCVCVKKDNPNVYIDSRLIEHFEKKGWL